MSLPCTNILLFLFGVVSDDEIYYTQTISSKKHLDSAMKNHQITSYADPSIYINYRFAGYAFSLVDSSFDMLTLTYSRLDFLWMDIYIYR